MATTKHDDETLDQLLGLRSDVRDANLKLDHIIHRLRENYFRRFYDLYGESRDG